MKLVTFVMCLIFLNSAFAKSCEVFGISDSPQKLNCTFVQLKLNLSCRNGDYYLNSARVDDAYHLEVDEGPVPLVFKSSEIELTVVIEDKSHIFAELRRGKIISQGNCL